MLCNFKALLLKLCFNPCICAQGPGAAGAARGRRGQYVIRGSQGAAAGRPGLLRRHQGCAGAGVMQLSDAHGVQLTVCVTAIVLKKVAFIVKSRVSILRIVVS